jgi:hypothetical protein
MNRKTSVVNNNREGAFKVMEAYLRLFEKSNQNELASHQVEAEARRCVLLAIKVPTEVDFAETLKLNAVKYLQGVCYLH